MIYTGYLLNGNSSYSLAIYTTMKTKDKFRRRKKYIFDICNRSFSFVLLVWLFSPLLICGEWIPILYYCPMDIKGILFRRKTTLLYPYQAYSSLCFNMTVKSCTYAQTCLKCIQ